MTSGRGDFELELSHYEETPPHIAERIIKQAQAAKAERMPEEEPELSEAAASELAHRIEAGEDGIAVPAELLEEPRSAGRRRRRTSTRAPRMKIAEKLKLAAARATATRA